MSRDVASWPWRKVLKLFWLVRSIFFTVDRPEGLYYSVAKGDRELEELLGRKHFTNNWEFSYKYRGEDLNMRRCFYRGDQYRWYQLHIRGWEQSDGSYHLSAHTELEPSHRPRAHLTGIQYNGEEGMILLKQILEEESFNYKRVEYKR